MAQAWLLGVLALLLIGRGMRALSAGVVTGQGFAVARADAPRLFATLLWLHAILAATLLVVAAAALALAGGG